MRKKRRASRPLPSYYTRKVSVRALRKRFLIVCEGEKTEPNYFRNFRVNTNVIEVDVHGTGFNTKSLVRKAIELKDSDDYDQVWCVFDRDSFSPEAFNAAISIAKSNNIDVAYSNEAFEIWYLLHFHYYNTGISRETYYQRLTALLGHTYQKNSGTLYEELLDRQPDAIRNAKRLLTTYAPNRPAHDNPSTTVYLLVEELNKFLT